MEEAHFVFVTAVIVDGRGLRDRGLRRVEGEVAAELAGRRDAELVGGSGHQQRGLRRLI
jgi:hypothetical protein